MTVHELVECLFAAGDWGDTKHMASLEAKIRAAVIDEESVGSISIKMGELDSYPLLDHLTLLVEEKPYEWNRYILVPRKDTP